MNGRDPVSYNLSNLLLFCSLFRFVTDCDPEYSLQRLVFLLYSFDKIYHLVFQLTLRACLYTSVSANTLTFRGPVCKQGFPLIISSNKIRLPIT